MSLLNYIMRRIPLLMLCFLWSLVAVQSQTEYPYITFLGNILPNHSYVDLSQVGDDRSSSDGNTVQCHTDLGTCCRSSQGIHRGDWLAPGSDTRLPFPNEGGDIFEDRRDQVVHLHRRNNANGPSGIYRCVIATHAIHDDSDQSIREIVYVGLYASGQGDITISGGMTLTVHSDLNGASPQFTLTCISTGGPATTVTWTRDSVTVTEGTETVLDSRVTSQYTHTLTVTGRLGGLYTCTVANNKPSEDSAQLTVGFPYVTFQGNILPNHSHVDLSQVGEVQTGSNNNTVQCHTDLSTCCRSSQGLHRGDWFAPGSDTRLPFPGEPGDIYEDRQAQVVHLRRRNNAGEPSGIYCCVIATNSVHDDSDQSVGEIVYVGLYANGQGDITISGGMIFTVGSDLNGASLQFTLTCISTGGPATTVTWTRDSVTVTEGIKTETLLDNRTTSQYTHTLTVTGRLGGLYTCTVANNKPSEDSAQLTVQAPSPPSAVRVSQNGLDSVLVSWTPPSGGPAMTGYIIYYQQQDGGHTGSEIAGATATTASISGLITGATYSITIVVTSTTLSSSEAAPVIITIGLVCSASGVCDVKIECEHLISQTLNPLYCSFNQGPLHPCTLPLLLNSDVSPLGNHSVRIVANGSEAIVSYTINEVSAQIPPLGVYLINESPRISNNSVRGEFLITRPVVGVRCFLRSQHDRIWKDCSSGQVFFPILRQGPYVLKVHAYNRKTDVATVKRGFVVTSDPNYCSLVLVNRGVVVSEDGTSAVVEVAVYGPATQLSCVLDGKIPFTCTSPVELSGLTEGQHTLRVSPIGCSGGSKTLNVQFTT